MFKRKRCLNEKQVLCELLPFLEHLALNGESAKQMLEKLCGLLGNGVDCTVLATVRGREEVFLTTLPEDEARYYRNPEEGNLPADRTDGKKTLRTGLEIQGILEGLWLFEVPEHVTKKEVSAYFHIASVLKFFLCSCLLARECVKQEKTDCFTGLPAIRTFEEELYGKLSRQEAGFLIVAKGSTRLPRPYRDDGINFFLINMADTCAGIHPDGVYRIGPDMVAVLCGEGKEEAVSVLQELVRMLPEAVFYLESLSELEPDSFCIQIQRGIDAVDGRKIVLGGRGIFPELPVFQEDV